MENEENMEGKKKKPVVEALRCQGNVHHCIVVISLLASIPAPYLPPATHHLSICLATPDK